MCVIEEFLLNRIPKKNHLYFVKELDVFDDKNKISVKSKKLNKVIRDECDYELFLKQKHRRPYKDIYASFQPFNEATKALYPFLKHLKKQLKPNDVILNLWDRSGWLTNLLSGMFPKQKILCTWEGNKDVLGYTGFNFWMKSQKNVEVFFCDPEKPLPFKDNSINCVVGMDYLHRFNQLLTIKETDRVTNSDGYILFPHVHLSNNNPVPFFERGGLQKHGVDYECVFKRLIPSRKTFVFSEPKLFVKNDIKKSDHIPLISEGDTTDYNGLIAVFPKKDDVSYVSSYTVQNMELSYHHRILVNRLLNINLNKQTVKVNSLELTKEVKSLFDRHPIFVERLEKAENYQLSDIETKVLFLSSFNYTVKQLSDQLNIKLSVLKQVLIYLENVGIIQVLPISEEALRLQNYLMTQHYQINQQDKTLVSLWKKALKKYPEHTAIYSLFDDSEFSYENANEIIAYIINALNNKGLKKGDKIVLIDSLHPEAILLFWACMHLGVVVVPLAEHYTKNVFAEMILDTNAKMCFTSNRFFKNNQTLLSELDIVLFDSEDVLDSDISFSDWIETDELLAYQTEIFTDDIAVILFTSGSTGKPKGVEISHKKLYDSGLMVSESFHWTAHDKFYCLGGLEFMSGLRNSCITALHCGAAVVIPSPTSNVLETAHNIKKSKATIIGSNPTFLRQLVQVKSKVKQDLTSITTVLCTGNKLYDNLRVDFKEAFNLDIYNYYGLTETTGICIAQNKNDALLQTETIGKSIYSIAQIVNDKDEVVGEHEEGELRIFSENLLENYYKSSVKNNIKNGWFYTNDIAKYDEQGNIYVLGRKQKVIKTANEEIVSIDKLEKLIQYNANIEDISIKPYIENDIEKLKIYIVLVQYTLVSTTELKGLIQNIISENLGDIKLNYKVLITEEIPYSVHGKVINQKLQ